MEDNRLEKRMYAMVLRQLSPMQKGIQALHAVVEYSELIRKYEVLGANIELCREYDEWAGIDKTMIILDGGTSNGLQGLKQSLEFQNIKVAPFSEPDLDGIMTAFCFITDERIWNAEKYPSLNSYGLRYCGDMNMSEIYSRYVKEIWDNEPFDKYLALRDLISSKKLSL